MHILPSMQAFFAHMYDLLKAVQGHASTEGHQSFVPFELVAAASFIWRHISLLLLFDTCVDYSLELGLNLSGINMESTQVQAS